MITGPQSCALRLFRLISHPLGWFDLKIIRKQKDASGITYDNHAHQLQMQGKLRIIKSKVYVCPERLVNALKEEVK